MNCQSRSYMGNAAAVIRSGCVRVIALGVALSAGLMLSVATLPALGQIGPDAASPAQREEVCRVYREAGVYAMELSNGVRLVVRPMRGDGRAAGTVHIVARVVGGVMHECGQSAGMSELATQSWKPPANSAPAGATPPPAAPASPASPAGGAAVRTPGASGRISAVAAPEGLMLRAQVAQAEAPATLLAMGRMLAKPEIDAERFERSRTRAMASARAVMNDDAGDGAVVGEAEGRSPVPDAQGAAAERMLVRAMVAMRDVMEGGASEPSVEALASASPELARAWLSHVVGASAVEVTIVGDVSPGSALEMTRAALGELNCGAWVDSSVLRESAIDAAARTRRSAPEQAEGVAAASTALRIERVLPAGVPGRLVVVGPGACMGDIASVRAWAVASKIVQRRLRAGVAGQGADEVTLAVLRSARAEALPRRLMSSACGLMVTMDLRADGGADGAGLSDERLRAIAREVWSQIDRVLEGDVTDEEVRTVGQALAADARRRLSEPGYWTSVLSMASAYGLSPDRLATAEDEYGRMTAQSLTETFRRRAQPLEASGVAALQGQNDRRGLALLPAGRPSNSPGAPSTPAPPGRTESERGTGSSRP
jgi:predicted Zn-dependent peptidase